MASRWAWAAFAFTVACAVAQTVLLGLAGVVPFSAEGVDEAFGVVTVATVCGAAVGAAIVTRHPGHRIGVLFCVGEAGTAFGLAAQAAGVAVRRGALPWPVATGHWATWTGQVFGGSYAFLLLALLFLLVPAGTLPSRRWRWALVLAAGSYAVVLAGVVLAGPDRLDPQVIEPPASVTALALGGQIGQILAVAAALIALLIRLRQADGEERQQLRWIAVAAAVLTASLLASLAFGLGRSATLPPAVVAVDIVLSLGFLGIPVATGFAVLRYRLYDVDVIIGSAVRLGVLVTFVTAGYVAVVVVLGRLAGGEGVPAWVSLVALVTVALAFQPVRRRAGLLADRAVYGDRAAPYEALATFSAALGTSTSEHDLLPRVARAAAAVTGAVRAEVDVPVPDDDLLVAHWPGPGNVPGPVVEVAVRDGDEVLGHLRLTLEPGDALPRPQRRLLDELAGRTALALRGARLAAELAAREEALLRANAELASSRRRLVTAGNAERERVAAAIDERVTTPMRPLPSRLAVLEREMPLDPAAVIAELGALRGRTERALDELRTITGGIFPALLARRGLLAALEAHADASGGRVNVEAGPGSDGRFAADVEAAAYFCAVAGDAGPLQVAVTADGATLRVQVTGAAPDGQDRVRVVDRVEAVGGHVEPLRDGGIVAVLPAEADR
jgi:signal transduction histidine kinase